MLDRTILFGSNEDGAKPRLLVVEDDTLHRMMICRAAAAAGYAPAGAASHDEAAKLLAKGPFAGITLGVRTNADMLHHLATIGCTAPIIVISDRDETTCTGSIALAKSLNLNVLDAMQKPLDLLALRSRLEQLKSKDAAAVAVA